MLDMYAIQYFYFLWDDVMMGSEAWLFRPSRQSPNDHDDEGFSFGLPREK